MQTSDERIPLTPLILGVGGLLPFVALCAGAWLLSPPDSGMSARYIAYYGAVILSFVGALHWGFAMLLPMEDLDRGRVYSWSTAPALAAWLALMLPTRTGLLLMAVMFLVHYGVDRRLAKETALPRWYLQLRLWLTLGAAASLLLALPRAA